MKTDEIIAMANTAAVQHGHTYEPEAADGTIEFLGSFAALVAAKRNEENAQLCESVAKQWEFHLVAPSAALQCAADIRARGTKEGA